MSLSPERPRRARREALIGLPSHLRRHARGKGELDEDLWSLFASERADAELDRAALVDRTLVPFADPELFPPQRDLGPFEIYRSATVRERASRTTRPSLVEPQFGWVVSQPLHLVRRGLINLHNLPPPRFFEHVRGRWRSTSDAAPAVLNLRDRGERVYSHVLQELIGGRIRLASEVGLTEVPIVISRALFERPFFQDVLRLSRLGDRRFILQEDRFVRSPEVFLVDTSPYSRAGIEFLRTALRVPVADPAAARRLFIVRGRDRKAGRGIVNEGEMSDVCRRFGFEIVAPEHMRLEQQIELFSQARILVGAHGSGLLNMIFRKGARMTVIEILPPGLGPAYQPRPWYFYMAAVAGHEHTLLHAGDAAGDGALGKAAYRQDFAVDPERLAASLAAAVDRT